MSGELKSRMTGPVNEGGLNIKLTELSQYIGVSRPTLYSYVDSYEEGKRNKIPENICKLFDLMMRPGATKEQAITFAISSIANSESAGEKDRIQKYLLGAADSDPKIELMSKLTEKNCLDEIIPYLSACIDVLSKERISQSELMQIARLVNFKSDVTRFVPLREDEVKKAKDILGGRAYE